jgi:hypothetical protein
VTIHSVVTSNNELSNSAVVGTIQNGFIKRSLRVVDNPLLFTNEVDITEGGGMC